MNPKKSPASPQARCVGCWTIGAAIAVCFTSYPAAAGEPWIAPGDTQLRHDLELLVDEGVIDMPITTWPIAASDLAAALGGMRKESASESTAIAAALRRLRPLAREGNSALTAELRGAARPTVLRTFEDTPREEGELSVAASGFVGQRWGARLELSAVVDPDDDKTVRLDGSYFAGKFGNWIFTAGAQDRWWGSGWEGSLILSNNARPVPALSLDRAVSDPFESKWLSWIGPWRLTTFMGYMDGDREDFDHPLLFGMRISARPLEGLEISVDRTAQWCGEGRSCNWDDFWNLWSGNDNIGENVDPEDEPGNQLASWEVRWASPIGSLPYTLYFQHTGETIDNSFPRPYRTLDLGGVEVWGDAGAGSSWRGVVEYAKTRCGGTYNGEKLWDCAYNNNVFNPDGYRYYGRPLGHSMDGDGEMYSARFVRVATAGSTWTMIGRFTRINDGGVEPDTRHSIAPGPEEWWSVDVMYQHSFEWGRLEAGVGGDYQDRSWNDTDNTLPRASLTWRHDFR